MVRLKLGPIVAVIFSVLCLGPSLAAASNDVLTQHNDNARSGANTNEKILTPANVNVNSFGKLFTQNVDGIIVGQPLYASNVLMSDGKAHNVVYVATQHNTVYAFDADDMQGANANPLWSVSLNEGGTSDPIADYGCTGTHYTEIGITGTGVIDPGKTTLYIVAKTLAGTVRNFGFHALDIRSGKELLGGPVTITGTVPSTTGQGTFNPIYQLQRPALLLQNGLVYVGFGGNGCDVYSYGGWLFAYNASTLQQEAAYLSTPNGQRGAIWQGGSGPATDEQGNIYVATGNGTYDGPQGSHNYGDSLLKLGWNGSQFDVLDYFTPYDQDMLNRYDLDLGSAGPLILPDQSGIYPHELIAGGKEGTLYLINRDNLGGFDPDKDTVVQSIPNAAASEIRGVETYWNGNVYLSGDADYIKQYALVNGLLTATPVSQTVISFPGNGSASPSITSNGASNGILWAIRHSGQALFAFDPTNLANKFYDSTQALHGRDAMLPVVRFITPTISNGKVYIGAKTALQVYGLLSSLVVKTGNNQTGVEKTVLPVSLAVTLKDAYAGQPLAGVPVACNDGGVGGQFTPSASQMTDATGEITFTYKLPPRPRAVTITCSSKGYISAVFNETAVVGPPAKMTIVSGNKQTAPPKTPLPQPLVVKVVDSNGIGVPGVTVQFTDNGAGGTFSSKSVSTSSIGTATVQYTTGPNPGTATITASSGSLTILLKETVQ